MDMQLALRSDIAMALDDCTAASGHRDRGARLDGALHALGRAQPCAITTAMPRASRRTVRHRAGRHAPAAAPGLARERCCGCDWPGLAVGGLAVGEPEEERLRMLEALVPHMPADRPRYLMGVGRPEDIVAAVLRGIDMFDCVMPTRHARNGHLFTAGRRHQHPQQRHTRRTWRRSTRSASCYTCRNYTPCLPAASGPLQRDPGRAAEHHPQPALLPGADALAAQRHRGRAVWRPSPAAYPGSPAGGRTLWHNAALFAARTAHMNSLIPDAWAQAAAGCPERPVRPRC